MRRWSTKDRLAATGILDQWREDVEIKGGSGTSTFEVELWFRADSERRTQLDIEVSSLIAAVDGNVISSCQIEQIRYHAILARVPSSAVESFLQQWDIEQPGPLLTIEGVMYFRPAPQSTARLVQPEPLMTRIIWNRLTLPSYSNTAPPSPRS